MRVDPAEDIRECGILGQEVARCRIGSSKVGYNSLVCDLRELLREKKVNEEHTLLWILAYVRFSRPYQPAIVLQQDYHWRAFDFAG